jgi:hypothetical protein
MNYTVLWRPEAEQLLADLWMTATRRSAVTAAANALDRALQHDPLGHGESRAGPTRILIERPLAIFYDVNEQDRIVIVWDVWLWPGEPA